jgi:murein DD-endopeptidase MepM/ murein hydrolase activator NlpD
MLRPARLDRGDSVRMGQRVGAVGCTGSCWGDHLHFEVRRGRGTTGEPRDPIPLLTRLAARRPVPE